MAANSNNTPQRGMSDVWWLNPWKLFAFFMVPGFTFIYLVPVVFGPYAVRIKFKIFFTSEYFALGLLFLFVILNFAWLASVRFSKELPAPTPPSFNRFYLDFLALVSIAAYIIWFRNLFIHPETLLAMLKGGSGGISVARTMNKTVGGVTTAAQFGVAYAILYFNQVWGVGKPFEYKRYTIYLYLLIGLVIFRMYVWAERLALIEFSVPIGVLYILYRVKRKDGIYRNIVNALPFMGVIGLFALFSATEYFRSWVSYYQYQGTGFFQFSLKRLTSYYYLALNNGAGMLSTLYWPTYEFYNILEWLHRFPFLVGRVFRIVLDMRPDTNFLERFADPEYNNPSGVFTVFYDAGIAGALIFAAVYGALLGYLYRSAVMRRGIGVILYPALYIALLEQFRILYIGAPRTLPIVLGLVLAYLLFREHRVERKAVEPLPDSVPIGARTRTG